MREDPGPERTRQSLFYIRRQKFKALRLANALLATGQAQLVEGNTWNDTYWGVCHGEGLNVLGMLLMQVRADLKNVH
jgi:predicted NAD-dependent protein-ADP-ribosyltransferase YbiA (DUF1768 family)